MVTARSSSVLTTCVCTCTMKRSAPPSASRIVKTKKQKAAVQPTPSAPVELVWPVLSPLSGTLVLEPAAAPGLALVHRFLNARDCARIIALFSQPGLLQPPRPPCAWGSGPEQLAVERHRCCPRAGALGAIPLFRHLRGEHTGCNGGPAWDTCARDESCDPRISLCDRSELRQAL